MSDRLERFRAAQGEDYQIALQEMKAGRKRNHWMWYIFPQLAGLGNSGMAQYYAIEDLEEAKAYMEDFNFKLSGQPITAKASSESVSNRA